MPTPNTSSLEVTGFHYQSFSNSEERGQSAIAGPSARVAGHGQAPLQGRSATARPPTGAIGHGLATYKGAASYGQGPPVKGRPATAKEPYTGGDRLRPTRSDGRHRPARKGQLQRPGLPLVGAAAP
ncbi:hypothetical protein BHE74_00042908 [Ensete ventricosum]|nr:hypothetical protein GW17_00030694 [Ensete ventricosum]RWW50796.1 hypothetical protein BHE74_00042908 [Ensete ventricosum]